MGEGVISSLSLILAGFLIALSLGISLGLYAGLTPRLKGLFLPVAKVISPIPPIVCGPYIIALMPLPGRTIYVEQMAYAEFSRGCEISGGWLLHG